jgi:hypothetical protein
MMIKYVLSLSPAAAVAGVQVPQHELLVLHEDGQQKLQLSVKLPGGTRHCSWRQ